MNLALEKRKQELANQYIYDPEQKDIFLNKATRYSMWANYIAGLILTSKKYKEFHVEDIRRELQHLLGNLYDGPGARGTSLLPADMAYTSKYHFGCPCLEKVDGKRGYYTFRGFPIKSS